MELKKHSGMFIVKDYFLSFYLVQMILLELVFDREVGIKRIIELGGLN